MIISPCTLGQALECRLVDSTIQTVERQTWTPSQIVSMTGKVIDGPAQQSQQRTALPLALPNSYCDHIDTGDIQFRPIL